MSKKPETKFYARLEADLRSIPCSFWQRIDLSYVRGIPDYLGCVHGRFVGLECKVGRYRATRIQEWTLRRIEEAGGVVSVVSDINIEQVLSQLKKL